MKTINLTKTKSGFTVIELIVVVAIIGILALMAAPFGSRFISQNKLDQATLELVDTLRRAQASSMSGHGNATWGVHFNSDSYVLFRGDAYSSGDPNNFIVELPNVVLLQDASLNGGGDDIIFNRVTGETAYYGSVTLGDTTTPDTNLVTINEVGLVEY